jgi:hypothetical protein
VADVGQFPRHQIFGLVVHIGVFDADAVEFIGIRLPTHASAEC